MWCKNNVEKVNFVNRVHQRSATDDRRICGDNDKNLGYGPTWNVLIRTAACKMTISCLGLKSKLSYNKPGQENMANMINIFLVSCCCCASRAWRCTLSWPCRFVTHSLCKLYSYGYISLSTHVSTIQYTVSQKHATIVLGMTSENLDRFLPRDIIAAYAVVRHLSVCLSVFYVRVSYRNE